MNARLRALKAEKEGVKDAVEKIERAATDAGRELTADENEQVETLVQRAEQLNSEFDAEWARYEVLNKSADIMSQFAPEPVQRASKADAEPMDAAHYFAEYFEALSSGNLETFVQRAVAQQGTTDTPGVLPTPIVGQVIKFADSRRPVFSSFSSRTMPAAGKTFERPRISQRVLVGEQASEHAELANRKMTLTSDSVPKRTFGGTLEISRQDQDWTDPAVLAIVIEDFRDYYAEVTEAAAVEFLASTASASTPYTATNVGTITTSYVNGAKAVYNSAKRNADTIWVPLDHWATLAGTVSSNDRPAIAIVNEALAQMGSFRWVVVPDLHAPIMGSSGLVEAYEQQHGLLTGDKISTLAVEISYSGYVAFHGRTEGLVTVGGSA